MSELLKECSICRTLKFNIEKRRLNTQYIDEKQNYMTSCKNCYDEAYVYYKEMWDDFYNNCM